MPYTTSLSKGHVGGDFHGAQEATRLITRGEEGDVAGPMWQSEEGRVKPGECWQQKGDVRRGISDRDSSTSGCSTNNEDVCQNYGTEGTPDGLHLPRGTLPQGY